MIFSEWLHCVYKDKKEFFLENPELPKKDIFYSYIYPRLYCNDGFNISIQGGELNYSEPTIKSKTYISMEIGFPSEYDEIIGVDYDDWLEHDVRGKVPIEEIERCIDKHHGINPDLSFKDFTSNNLQKSKYMRLKKLNRIIEK